MTQTGNIRIGVAVGFGVLLIVWAVVANYTGPFVVTNPERPKAATTERSVESLLEELANEQDERVPKQTRTRTIAESTIKTMRDREEQGQPIDPASVTESSRAYIESIAKDTLYTADDIRTTAGTPATYRTYGNEIARIVRSNAPPADTRDEIEILYEAIRERDQELLDTLAVHQTYYETLMRETRTVAVPDDLRQEHLDLLNVYNALANDIAAFQETFRDPIVALTRFQRYQEDAAALYYAISAVYLALDERGITWEADDEASKFIRISDSE